MDRLVPATGHLHRGHVGQLSSALNSGRVYNVWRCRQTLSSTVLQCRHSRVCAFDRSPSVFQPVTFESQRLTNESHLVYPRYWSSSSHCCVLIWWCSSLSFGYWFPRGFGFQFAGVHGLSFHSGTLRGVRGRGISTGEYREEFAQRAAALERLFLCLKVPREASSLKLLREKVNPQKSSQDSR